MTRYNRLFVFVAISISATVRGFVTPSPRLSHRIGSALNFGLDQKEKKSKTSIDLDTEILDQVKTFDPFQFGNSDKTSNLKVSDRVKVKEDENDNDNDNENDGKLGIWAARGLLLLVAMLWGTNFASVKYLETLCFHPPCDHPPSEAALARFGVAALVSMPLLIGKRLDVILGGLECGLWITLGYITQAEALQSIGAGKCAFICSLTVVIVPIIEMFFGKPLKGTNVASALVALTGVGVLEGLIDVRSLLDIEPALADTTTAAETLVSTSAMESTDVLTSMAQSLGVSRGDLLALGQPFGFGFSFLRIEHYVEKFEKVENRVLTIAAAQCVAVGLCAFLWVLFDFGGHIPDLSYMIEPHRLAAIGWTGIMTTVVAIYLEGVALQTASATEAAITFASEPVWASLFGAYLLREKLGFSSWVGGAIIMMGCILGAVGDLPVASEKNQEEEE